jgi:teichuronic acid biosynthesis glycosyltransferase TuaC
MTTVGVVTTSYPRGADDWAGSFVRTRVRELVAAGARVEVVAAGDAAEEEPGVEVIRIPAPRTSDRPLFYAAGAGAPEVLDGAGLAGIVAAAAFAARLCEVVARRSPRWQAVESHWLAPCALAVAAVAPGLPHVAVAHGGDVALLERLPAGDALARLLAARAALTFASGDLRERFARLCGQPSLRASVAPAPFDPTLFHPPPPGARAAARRRLGAEGPVVLAVGRLVPIKGFDLLVRAVGRLPTAGRPGVVLVGEGPERPRLAALAAARDVALRLPGALPPGEVAAWMAAADAYAQPSRTLASGRTEGTPLATREALAVGLPIVAAAIGGLRELAAGAGDSRIRLVTPDDPAALAAALAQILGG